MTRAPKNVRLLLDEMHAPVVAATLRTKGHDVESVADDPNLRAMSDEELFTYAARHGQRVVTENLKDFRPLLHRAEDTGEAVAGLLLTSSRTFPRSRRNPGLLVDALHSWLSADDADKRPIEDWLMPASRRPS